MSKPPPDADRADADPRADLDRDGIKDIEDPCIAPEVDGLIDSDGDGVLNADDRCPFDASATDGDGDGIPDACDPFGVAGDRVRCVMVFTDTDMNAQMWRPRGAMDSWFIDQPKLLWGFRGSIAADWPIEGNAPTTTFDISGRVGFTSNMPGRIDVLPRAGIAPQPTDAGCALMSGSSWTLGILPGPTSVQTVMAQAAGMLFRMRVTMQPTQAGTNIRCTLRWPSGSITTFTGTTVWPTGHMAFSANAGTLSIYGIAIYERDDAPAL